MKRQTIYSNDTRIKFYRSPYVWVKRVLIVLLIIKMVSVLRAETVMIDPSVTYNAMNDWEATPIWEDVASDGFYTPKLIPFQD